MSWYMLLFILGFFNSKTESVKILAVFPAPAISHQIFFRQIYLELVKRGHQVTVITPDPAFPKRQSPANLTEIDIHHESYSEHPRGKLLSSIGSKKDIYTQMLDSFNIVTAIFEKQMSNKEVRNLIGKKFDLIITESCIRPSAVFSSFFKAPVIQMSSFAPMIGFEGIVGAPYHPLLYPNFAQQTLYNLSIWQKIREVYVNLWVHNMFIEIERKEDQMLKRLFGPDIPPMSKLKQNVDLMFINVHPIWIDNQPMPPNVILMGGLHKQPRKNLPKDLQTYLDSSSKEFIYVSFGSNVLPSQLMPEKIEIMKQVFSKLPYNILWKWDEDEMIGRSHNINISKWFPQADILRHPKVKLFITQGGLQSTDEAIDAEVPMIGIPILVDQWYNTEKYVRHKIGTKIDFDEINEENLRYAINEVINDKSYHENIKRLKILINDAPQKPLDNVIWWIEYVLRHGGAAHLRSPAANISWTEYYEIKLLFTLFAVTAIIISITMYTLYTFYRCFVLRYCTNVKYKTS